MKRITLRIFLAATIALFMLPSAFPEESVTQIVIILDASGSMWGKAGDKSKIDAAKETLISLVDDLAGKPVLLGLRIYGHLNRKCTNSVLEIPVGPLDAKKISAIVMPLKPKGKTPIAYSLIKAADDFRKDIRGDKIIIIITDGIETCGGNPCEVALRHRDAGVATKVHVVGFGMNPAELSSLACIVKPSGGILVSARDQDELHTALKGIVGASVRRNLVVTASDKSGQNVFSNVTVTKDMKEIARSEGIDVGFYLEKGTYDIAVKNPATGKEIGISGVAVDDDHIERRNISFAGSELVFSAKDTSGNPITTLIVVHDSANGKIISMLEKNTVHHIPLVPGTYDIEVQDLDTNCKEWIRGISIADNVERGLVFKRGRLVINTRNARGIAIKTSVEVIPKNTSMEKLSSPGKTRHEFILPEGFFDLVVRYWYSRAEQSISDVSISDGKVVEKDVVIDTD